MADLIPIRRTVFVILCAFLLVGAAAGDRPAQAQGIQVVAEHGDWRGYTFSEDGNVACYMSSRPTESKGKYNKRGDIYMIITHRPVEKRKDEVSVVAGYSYKKDSWVKVTIGGHAFDLFTHEDGAWTRGEDDDRALVRAMISGATMVVKGTSSRGTLTTDTYSLRGFSKTYKGINKACGY